MARTKVTVDKLAEERERCIQQHIARVSADLSRQEQNRWPRVRLSTIQKKIVQKFQLGLKLVCGVGIWEQLMTFVTDDEQRELTETELESRFLIGRSSINKGRNSGAVSLETVAVMLSDLDRDLSDLSLPERRVRLLGAYREAMSFVGQENARTRDADLRIRKITLEELLGTVAVLTVTLREEWISKKLHGPLNTDDWNAVAVDSQKIFSQWSDADTKRPATGIDAKYLIDQWGEIVLPVIEAIPQRWFAWTSEGEPECVS